ncbi:rcc01693 family protein [Pararhizobium haloflavum]|uniref:rcc01693 family protein n=1 Tax=Pararhizobium haloflavum TaxID=2037914 RepID=UPI0027B93851|nr:rcc01693 family protein [Pararhizobium haloflavum]
MRVGRPAAVPFPWRHVMHFGLARLRLPPEQFWRLTPRELAAMAGGSASHDARPDVSALAALMARYPDEEKR